MISALTFTFPSTRDLVLMAIAAVITVWWLYFESRRG
jgi:hypothetical protein